MLDWFVTDSMDPESQDPRSQWTPEQSAELMRLSRNNQSALDIAMKLGRTEESVQVKARQLGLLLSSETDKGRRG